MSKDDVTGTANENIVSDELITLFEKNIKLSLEAKYGHLSVEILLKDASNNLKYFEWFKSDQPISSDDSHKYVCELGLGEITFQKTLLRNVLTGSAGIKIIDKSSNTIVARSRDYAVITVPSVKNSDDKDEIKNALDIAKSNLVKEISKSIVSKATIPLLSNVE
jgi:hypothetical protein